jgi:hypothetical protein
MTPENKAFIERFLPFYDKIGQGDIHIELSDRRRIREIIQKEFDPKYNTCITCPEGIVDLLKMMRNNYNELPKAVAMTFPKHQTPEDLEMEQFDKEVKTKKNGAKNTK